MPRGEAVARDDDQHIALSAETPPTRTIHLVWQQDVAPFGLPEKPKRCSAKMSQATAWADLRQAELTGSGSDTHREVDGPLEAPSLCGKMRSGEHTSFDGSRESVCLLDGASAQYSATQGQERCGSDSRVPCTRMTRQIRGSVLRVSVEVLCVLAGSGALG